MDQELKIKNCRDCPFLQSDRGHGSTTYDCFLIKDHRHSLDHVPRAYPFQVDKSCPLKHKNIIVKLDR